MRLPSYQSFQHFSAPLRDEPYYRVGFEAGSFGRYQPSLDFSGPLTADESILYRFIAAHRGGGDFQDSTNAQITTIAPSLTFRIGDQTDLNLYYEYNRFYADPITFALPLLNDGSLPPANFYPTYLSSSESESNRFGYTLNHELSDNWQIRNNVAVNFTNSFDQTLSYSDAAGGLVDGRFLTDFIAIESDVPQSNYFGQIDLVGRFETGSISHQLVAGFDFNRFVEYFGFFESEPGIVPNLDVFDPDYDVPLPDFPSFDFSFLTIDQSYGVYIQDQITFGDNLKMLIGGRYDWLTNESGEISGDRTPQSDGAFSPRIGLVYQPSQNLSLYTSYSQSFRPAIGRNPDNRPFEPTRGTQYEIGARADFLDGRLSANLAAYYLTRTNVLTPDPDPVLAGQGFQVQVGQQRSQGIELGVAGEILPGWNITASYAYTDAEITVDNSTPSRVGDRPRGVPEHQASLWTAYTIQEGDLQGLGFGLGLFYVGEREPTLANTIVVEDYLRTDAAIYYRRGGFRAAVNVRNLFNIDYITTAFSRPYVTRGEPLTVTASVSWEF